MIAANDADRTARALSRLMKSMTNAAKQGMRISAEISSTNAFFRMSCRREATIGPRRAGGARNSEW